MKTEAIIAAGGKGERFGEKNPKQFYYLAGKPILCWTIFQFEKCKKVDKIILVVPQGMEKWTEKLIFPIYKFRKIKEITEGGKERNESVLKGLKKVDEDTNLVIIHDGVRPLISSSLIEKVIDETEKYGAVTPGLPAKETLKKIKEGWVKETLKRKEIYSIQTPQGFWKSLILEAYQKVEKSGWRASDDATLVEKLGHKVKVTLGEEANIKITTPLDVEIAEFLLKKTSELSLPSL